MKTLTLSAVVFALLSGCASITVTKKDNGDCRVVYASFFKDLQQVTGDVCGGRVEVSGSSVRVDSAIELLNAVK